MAKTDPTISTDANDRPGGELNPDAPVASQPSGIVDAKYPDDKPDPSTIAQVEKIG